MAVNWSALKSEINTGILQEMGSQITVSVPSSTSTRSSSGKKVPVTYTEYTGIAVKGKYNSEWVNSDSVVQAGDVKFICQFDDEDFEPLNNKDETITFGDITYKIVNVASVDPDGTALLVYVIQARRVN